MGSLSTLVSEAMKKYLLNIFLFFCIVAVADLGLSFVCKYMIDNTHSGDVARITGLLKKNHYDLMTMGSSRCVCHYDDQLMSDSLGLKVINAGFEGNGIILMFGRYHIIPKENKPQILIYDVEPSFDVLAYENDDHNRRYLSDLKMFYDENGISDIFRRVDRRESIKMQSSMYRFNSKLFVLIRDYIRKSGVQYSFYQPTDRQYSPPVRKKEDTYWGNDSLKLHYMEQLMIDTKADGVQMIVVASPKYGATSTIDVQPVIDLCNKHGVPFWDYYLDMHDPRWFCDNMHLNREGSKEFTKAIIERIRISL